MKRFKKKFNKGKTYYAQIKPFNFILTRVSNNKEIKPITSFSKSPQEAVYKPFVDYESGEVIEGIGYWKPLSDVLLSYSDHKESKLKGDVGVLERRHLNVDGFVYIGKKASNLDRTGTLDKLSYSMYQDQEVINKMLLEITPKEAKEEFGIRYGSTLKKIKDKLRRCRIRYF